MVFMAESIEPDRTVGQVAKLHGITVRTLHHWDDQGLVCPSGRSYAGYRLYSPQDLERLQQALVYREIGLELSQIKNLLDSPKSDAGQHLRRQRDLLDEKIHHLRRMIHAVDTLLEDTMNTGGTPLTTEQKAQILGDDWRPEYEQEAQEHWGDTDAWKSSQKRQARMSADDWAVMKADLEVFEAALADAMTRGIAPGSPEANKLAEQHLEGINFWYPASHSQQVLLAQMYTADPRFKEHYDQRAEGLADWLAEVIYANARANGVDPETAIWE